MAQRRMFSKSITNSSRFLMMPPTAQLLYVHLSMNADDDGFVEHFPIMRMVEAKPDDLKLLQYRGFAHVFDDKVLIIADWKENNYLRNDRYTPSKYLAIYQEELRELAQNKGNLELPMSGIPDGYQRDTQVRLGKDSKEGILPSKIHSSEEDLNLTPLDNEGEELAARPPKKPKGERKNEVALRIQRKFADMCEKAVGVRPIIDVKGYFAALYAINTGGLTEKQIYDLFDDWFGSDKADDLRMSINAALSARSINAFKLTI